MRTGRYRMNVFLIVCLLVSLFPTFGTGALAADAGSGSVTDDVYAVSLDGSRKLKLNHVNVNVDAAPQKKDYVALFTSGTSVTNVSGNNNAVFVKTTNAAIQVDAQGNVLKMVGPQGGINPSNNKPYSWDPDQNVTIPPGGFVLLASDDNWLDKNFRKALYNTFQAGDTIALERGGVRVTAADFLPDPAQPTLQLSTASGTTVTTATYTIQGKVLNYVSGTGLAVKVGDADASVQPDGSFSQPVTLTAGANTIPVKLLRNADVLQSESVVITYHVGDLIEIEAPPEDITIVVEGPKKPINYIDKDVTGIPNIIALFTTEYASKITIPATNVAIQVDASGKVMKMINKANGTSPPSWVGGELDIPQGGYVVMAQDNSYATLDFKKYLATKFNVGDVVKLRKNGNVVPVSELMTGLGAIPRLQLDGLTMYTTPSTTATIAGKVTNPDGAVLQIGGTTVAIGANGTFSHQAALTAGPNYIDVTVSKGGTQHDKKSVIVYSRPSLPAEKQVILWVDQASNAKKFQSSQAVLDFLTKAKNAGVTDVAFDVKGVEGFVSYKKNDLTHRPYVSEMTAVDRQGSNPDLDLLELFLTHSHALGLKVHAAFNVFAEGSIAVKDFAIIDQHLDWEERVYRVDDGGEIKRLRESAYGQRGLSGAANGAAVLFVNPANDEVRDFQLKTFEEVLKNYDVDGIILDRGRYDNETADFSDVTKQKFEAFLQQRGKQLNAWPQDIFRYEDGRRVDGPLIQDWWEFRSGTIESFVKETRQLVDRYTASKGRKIETSAYVGAWFESYYLNGVHWGSKNFRYDSRLNFPTNSIYTDGYYQTGYIDHMDFLMVGTYYSTPQEIQRYITLDSIVTNGEVPLYAGMALADLQSPELQRTIFQTALGSSNGLMLFDASLANWPIIKASIDNETYVKDYQIGMSKPGSPSSFIEGDFYNVSRNLGDLNVYNDEYGTSTGGNRFGVEVVADATGKVVKMANKSQAINWNWSAPQDNNSAIPPGGMVISALDLNGVRTKRQLIANSYNIGDDIRAAALSGFLNYDGKTVSTPNPELRGNVKVLGAGTTVNVTLNGTAAAVAPNGDFAGRVNLQQGVNTVTFAVYVDNMKTNEKSIQLTYTPESSSDDSSTTPPPSSGPVVTTPNQPAPTTPAESGVVIPATPVQTTDDSGKPAMKVTLDADALNKAISSLRQQGSTSKQLIVEVSDTQPVAIVSLPAQSLNQAADSVDGAVLTVRSGGVTYHLPADLLDIDAIASELGVQAGDMQVLITLEKITGTEADAIADAVEKQGGEVIGDVYDFSLRVQAGGKTRTIDDFGSRYAERSLTLSGNVSGSATAVVIDPATGEMTFVPARFIQANGKTTVIIKRTGNSLYTVVSYSKTFDDMKGHWAQADIERLASKLLVKGVTDTAFAPDQSITRAEFAALLVRALGLTPQDGSSSFGDVRASDWFASAAATASKAGLIEGYEDGTFRPNQAISREELAVLAARAFDFVDGRAASGSPSALQAFADAGKISGWARDAAALAVSEGILNGVDDSVFAPQDHTSRAQAAVMLKRLATKLGLMN
ncbi:S-layer homology domain-containing protein [Paenibacillus flagellatus]|uniref:S-layer protein n=1 Tax=Paenibacillus flagellatus TaxID=2211139 RepID=A0A2V5K184_9BACL|nr:S-layer homology domain-containing protein [Paenibacillus flagellatus]PYI51484.1 S-layer protein [Paenibacillus flagellatus]